MISRLATPLLAIALIAASGCATNRPESTDAFEAAIAPPALPTIPDKKFSLTDYGPVADGVTDSTDAFARAIAAVDKAGGGHLNVPPGRYLIKPFKLVSNLDLHLDADATLVVYNDIDTFPSAPAKMFQNQERYTDVISADFCHDVAITGSGVIDGQGSPWWKKYRKRKGPGPQPAQQYTHRPNLVVFNGCQRVRVEGVTLTNSPCFHLIPQQCQDVTIDGLTITAPADAPNTDGMDPSGQRIAITHCVVSVGDDNIVFKPQYPSSFPKDKLTPGHVACEDLLVAGCHFGKGHGMSIGGQTTDGLKRLLVRDCTFDGTTCGVRLKAEQGSGGLTEDCVYTNLNMTNVQTAFFLTSYYPTVPKDPATMPAKTRDEKTPVWKHIRVENVTAVGSQEAGGIIGLAERPVLGVTFKNVSIEAKKQMRIVDANDVVFENSTIHVADGKPGVVVTRADVRGIDLGAWTGAIAPIERTGGPAGGDETTQPTTDPAK